MATSGVTNGTLMSVKFGESVAAVFPLQTECSISVSMDTRDITTKGSGGYRELLGGLRSGSITFSALHDMDQTNGLSELMGVYNSSTARGECSVAFTTDVTGDDYYTATAMLTSLDISAGTEDNVTISGTFELSGTITFGQVS
jgi:predicted secreted protein